MSPFIAPGYYIKYLVFGTKNGSLEEKANNAVEIDFLTRLTVYQISIYLHIIYNINFLNIFIDKNVLLQWKIINTILVVAKMLNVTDRPGLGCGNETKTGILWQSNINDWKISL